MLSKKSFKKRNMGEIQYRTTGVPQAYRRRTIPQACHRRTTGVLQACRRHTAGVPQAYRHATGVPQAIQSLLSVPANESQAKRSSTSSVPKLRSPALNPSPATPRWRASQHRWPGAIGCVWKGFNPFYPFQQMSPRPREAPPAACPSQGARPLTLLPRPRGGVLPSTGGPGQLAASGRDSIPSIPSSK